MKIELRSVDLPRLQEIWTTKQYYKTNEYDNWFDKLVDYYEKSNMHSTLTKNLARKIYGTGVVNSTTNLNDPMFSKVLKKCAFDYALFGSFAFKVKWSLLGEKIVNIEPVNVAQIRVASDAGENTQLYFHSNTWKTNYVNNRWMETHVTAYPAFNLEKPTGCQLFYFHDTIGNQIYNRPDYASALDWIFVDSQLGRYYANLVENNFVANTILSIQGNPDPEIKQKFNKDLKENFTNPENAGSVVVLWYEGENAKPEILKFNQEGDDQKYAWLADKTLTEISVAHALPNPALAGVLVPGKLGNTNGDDLQVSENIYNKNKVIPMRNDILEVFDELMPYYVKPFPYTVENITLVEEAKESTPNA